jgi:hypothetical protein
MKAGVPPFARWGRMRAAASTFLSAALLNGSVAVAQVEGAAPSGVPNAETPDEVVVTAKRLGELRIEVQDARKHAYDIFNDINSDNEFDVHCGDQTRVFSHAKVFVCRAQFEKRIEAQAAREYLQGLVVSCRGEGGVSQACMFSAAGQRAITRAAAVENPLQGKRDRLNDEIIKLANENPQFAQAILEFYAASQKYEAARTRRNDN